MNTTGKLGIGSGGGSGQWWSNVAQLVAQLGERIGKELARFTSALFVTTFWDVVVPWLYSYRVLLVSLFVAILPAVLVYFVSGKVYGWARGYVCWALQAGARTAMFLGLLMFISLLMRPLVCLYLPGLLGEPDTVTCPS